MQRFKHFLENSDILNNQIQQTRTLCSGLAVLQDTLARFDD